MYDLLLSPPSVFVITAGLLVIISFFLKRLAFRKEKPEENISKPYACGEDVHYHNLQPDYSQFFPFAYFFTILHVVTLFVATAPLESLITYVLLGIYITGAVVGMLILWGKQ